MPVFSDIQVIPVRSTARHPPNALEISEVFRVIRRVRASGPLHQGLVCLVEVVGEGYDGEDAGNQARDGRGEDEAVCEEGGYPLADAELAGQKLPEGLPQALAPGLLLHPLGALFLL